MPQSTFCGINFDQINAAKGAFLQHFLIIFGGCRIDHENTGYVKFVDSIEKLVDFLENKAMDLENSRKFRVLEYAVFVRRRFGSHL